jgi:uncharacterized phage infection (PIP) family protein YhgE
MKIHTLALATALLLSALPLACKTTEGHDRAETTADQVVALGAAAGGTQSALDQTLKSLEEVVATKDKSPKTAYDAFAKGYGSFVEEFASLNSTRAGLKSKAEVWFTEFEKQNSAIQDADLRKSGEKRLETFREGIAETSKQVDKLIEGTSGVEARLKDLRTFLSNDLTPDGIGAVEDRIKDLAKDGRKAAGGLGELRKSSEALAEKLRAARAQAPAAK